MSSGSFVTCGVCGDVFPNVGQLNFHLVVHINGAVPPDECEPPFAVLCEGGRQHFEQTWRTAEEELDWVTLADVGSCKYHRVGVPGVLEGEQK